MVAALAFEIAVSIIAADGDGGVADPGFFRVGAFQKLHLKALDFRPAEIHPQKHLGPVGGIGAALARLHFEIGVARVFGLRHDRLEFDRIHLGAELFERGRQFLFARLIFLGELQQHGQILRRLREFLQRFDGGIDPAEFAHHALGFFLVVPEIGRGHQLVDFLNAGFFGSEVKDCPANEQSAESTPGRLHAIRDSSRKLLGERQNSDTVPSPLGGEG